MRAFCYALFCHALVEDDCHLWLGLSEKTSLVIDSTSTKIFLLSLFYHPMHKIYFAGFFLQVWYCSSRLWQLGRLWSWEQLSTNLNSHLSSLTSHLFFSPESLTLSSSSVEPNSHKFNLVFLFSILFFSYWLNLVSSSSNAALINQYKIWYQFYWN